MAESTDPTTAVPNLYQPLDADRQGLRLLEISPSEDSDSPVQVKIFACRFEDVRGQFIPLSYVWGDPTDTETIIVNEVPRNVTKSLALFLRQIRALLPKILTHISWEKPALFWADAICINQDDTEERNRQVQLMGSIYGSAPATLAWLGHGENSQPAADMVDAFEAWATAHYEKNPDPDAVDVDIWDPNSDGWMERHPDFWSFSRDVARMNPYWDAIIGLLNSPYWQRTWIFQEIVLPAEAVLMYGSALVTLSSLPAPLMWMLAFPRRAASDFSFLTPENYQKLRRAVGIAAGATSVSIYEPIQAKRDLANQQRPTLTLVPLLGTLLASDPRDKIFGLLGVMDTHLIADYNKPVVQVYSEFVSAWIREVQNLNFLLIAYRTHHREAQPGLPSWAPDWSAVSLAMTQKDVIGTYPIGPAMFNYSLEASAHLVTGPASMDQSCRILTAAGVVCDQVEEVYPNWMDSEGLLAIGADFLNFVQRYRDRSMLDGRGCSSRHIFQILFRTGLRDSSPLGTKVRLLHSDATKIHTWGICFLLHLALCYDVGDDPWPRHLDSMATTFLPRLGIPHGPEFSRFWREEIFSNVKLEEPEEPEVAHWQDATAAFQWAWENHSFEFGNFQTQSLYTIGYTVKFFTKNNYVGVATSAEVGDKVVVLAGCNAPVLLRPKGGHYEHIGPCFVLGLMDGEAKDMVDRGEAKLETFEIH